jgi:hypothetical protein
MRHFDAAEAVFKKCKDKVGGQPCATEPAAEQRRSQLLQQQQSV